MYRPWIGGHNHSTTDLNVYGTLCRNGNGSGNDVLNYRHLLYYRNMMDYRNMVHYRPYYRHVHGHLVDHLLDVHFRYLHDLPHRHWIIAVGSTVRRVAVEQRIAADGRKQRKSQNDVEALYEGKITQECLF